MTEIQEQFNKVLCYSQAQSEVNTDKLFDIWQKAKQRFILLMGNKLIYECPEPVTVYLPTAARDERIDGYIEKVWEISGEIGEFLTQEKEGLIDNKVWTPYTIRNKEVPVGMRIGKALHKFFDVYCSANELEWIIQELSRIIQENTVTGKLCISVHPLDFLSLSENNHSWRSCHALDGEYRSGNLSYMCDEVTAIAYIKSEEDTILPRFPEDVPWNNKKWRCLLFCDAARNIIWAGRQYPFTAMGALDLVDTKLLSEVNYFDLVGQHRKSSGWVGKTFKKFSPKFDANSDETFELTVPHLHINGKIYSLKNFVSDHKNSMAYNDLLRSHYYTPIYLTYGYPNFSPDVDPIVIGGDTPCIHCGERHIYNSDAMFCSDDLLYNPEDTDDIVYCACCGDRMTTMSGEQYHGEWYCADCYDRLDIRKCDYCGTEVSWDDAIHTEDGHLYCCRYCMHDAEEQPEEGY